MNDLSVARARRKPVCRRVCMGVLALAGFAAHAGSVSCSYDAVDRLTSAVYSDGSTTTITYSYDAAGNCTSVATASP